MKNITESIDEKINKIKVIDLLIDNISIIKKVLLAIAIFIPIYIYFNISDAKDYGSLAINLLFLSLLIGPLGKIFKNKIFKFLMLIRGEIGILMASAAIGHGLSFLLRPKFQENLAAANFKMLFTDMLPLTLGIIALLLTIPLLITSNKYLKDKMGIWWFRLHKLAYAIFILGALHAATIKTGFTTEAIMSAAPIVIIYTLIVLASKKWGKK